MYILDAIRVNVKYSVVPEKEIDNSLGIWLSHAPFRIKKLSKNKKNSHQEFFHQAYNHYYFLFIRLPMSI